MKSASPDWENAIAFKCSTCRANVIVSRDSLEADRRECCGCARVPTLEDAPETENYQLTRYNPPAGDVPSGESQASRPETGVPDGQMPGTARSAASPECRERSGASDRPRSGQRRSEAEFRNGRQTSLCELDR